MSEPHWASPGDQSEPPPAAPTGPPVPESMPEIQAPTAQPGYGPVVSPPPVGDGPDDATPMYYAVPNPDQNWGLNPHSGVRYEVLVPRPPRPGTVSLALLLTYVGVGVAMVYLVISSISQWQNRDRVVADATRRAAGSDVDMTSLARNSVGVILVVTVVFWVLIAAGFLVCAMFANRGRNGARITLASVMGAVGLYQLCGAVSVGAMQALSSRAATASSDSPLSAFTTSQQIYWWTYVGPSLLAVIALIVFVLLIIPPSNRYFSAGPGRRFAPAS